MTKDELDALLDASREIIEQSLSGNLKVKEGPEGQSDNKLLDDLLSRAKNIYLEETEDEVIEVRQKIDLSLINVDPSAKDVVSRIKAIKRKPKSAQPKVITCLFHGAPGTGKTTLAQEVVRSLGKKPLIKSYADIQSKYVGEGEKQLKAIFEEARQKDKVLILDECDALMMSRERTDKEWQKSMTNQFLTELDKHTGIFIATTNFVEMLDAACLRRLFLKMKFDWMTSEQKVKAFKVFFAKKIEDVPVQFLTAGDFKAVKERSLYEPSAKISTERYIELLRDEVSYKKKTMKEVMEATKTKIGF